MVTVGALNVIEVSKKQYYIFKSNKLKENIGASEIIRFVTEELAQRICNSNKGEIINTGGGRSLFYFENKYNSISFVRNYSFYLLENYPLLELFISSVEYNPDKDSIIEKIEELQIKLEKKKARRENYSSILDFGITEKCDSTRMPAVCMINDNENENIYYSSESKSKIKMFNEVSKNKEYKKYAVNFSELGISRNEKSFIAITHIDGNRMGKKIKLLKNKYESLYNSENTNELNKKYINDLQNFSNQIKIAFINAFQKVVDTIQANVEFLKEKGLNIKDGVLPIRKVILSGDDVCYITDARIAIDCAAIFLNELEKYKVLDEKITACAGIAMVREKYPFFKTYELSEQLCRQAKSSIPDDVNESRLDWHIVQGEYNNNLNEIRNTMYRTYDEKQLLLRPLIVSVDSDGINHYRNFKKDIQIINSGNIPRNKVKNMLTELKKGQKHTDTYIEIHQLYTLLGSHRIGYKTGFAADKCVLFDAIETMDYYIPLHDGEV